MFQTPIFKTAFSCMIISFFINEQALAQFGVLSQEIHETQFTSIAPPATLKWELATATDERVSATVNDIEAPGLGQQIWQVTEISAAEYGVDWDAWQSAALDPRFTRSLITFGSLTRESRIVRSYAFTDPFRRDYWTSIGRLWMAFWTSGIHLFSDSCRLGVQSN
jgi:hypothetical protein